MGTPGSMARSTSHPNEARSSQTSTRSSRIRRSVEAGDLRRNSSRPDYDGSPIADCLPCCCRTTSTPERRARTSSAIAPASSARSYCADASSGSNAPTAKRKRRGKIIPGSSGHARFFKLVRRQRSYTRPKALRQLVEEEAAVAKFKAPCSWCDSFEGEFQYYHSTGSPTRICASCIDRLAKGLARWRAETKAKDEVAETFRRAARMYEATLQGTTWRPAACAAHPATARLGTSGFDATEAAGPPEVHGANARRTS